MPLLKRQGVPPLLKTVNSVHADGSRRRKAPSDIDPDASPISLSEASEDAELVDELANEQPAKRPKISDDYEDASRNPRKTEWKNQANAQTKPNGNVAGLGSQDDDKLAAFDEIHSSSSSMRRRIEWHRKQTMKTSNIHTSAAEKKKVAAAQQKDKNKKTDVPAKAMFRIPEDDSQPLPDDKVKGFGVPIANQARNGKSKKSTFLLPEDVQGLISSSAPTSLPPTSSKPSSPGFTPRNPANHAAEADLEAQRTISLDSSSSSPEPFIGTLEEEEARCPMCKAEVSKPFLDSFKRGRKLTLKEAMDFCLAHKAQNAQSSWATSQYPTVDWATFEKRLRRFNHRLGDILAQKRESHFRKELAAKVASGWSRNALRNPEAEGAPRLSAVTGYYGAKGAQKMMEHITNKFAGKIRKVATEDELFTEVGVGGFIQAVLVPELAVLLVMEDYGGCDEARAREILNESAEMGDLVHAEEEDRIEQHGAVESPASKNQPESPELQEGPAKPNKAKRRRRNK